MPVVLIARFNGDVGKLTEAYDRAHATIMRRGGAVGAGELRHHCATSRDALYIIGVWDSEEHARSRWASEDFRSLLTSVGFPSAPTETTILDLHAIEPPLPAGAPPPTQSR
jgi:hypothetical protein